MSYESTIQAAILKKVRSWKWEAHKNRPGSDGLPSGWPDITVYLPNGKVVLLEIKRPGGEASVAQKYTMQRLIRWGYATYLVDNLPHAVRVILKEFHRGGQRGAPAA